MVRRKEWIILVQLLEKDGQELSVFRCFDDRACGKGSMLKYPVLTCFVLMVLASDPLVAESPSGRRPRIGSANTGVGPAKKMRPRVGRIQPTPKRMLLLGSPEALTAKYGPSILIRTGATSEFGTKSLGIDQHRSGSAANGQN